MRTETIIRKGMIASDTINYTMGKGHLNGLLFFATGGVNDTTMTIKRRTADRTYVLAANVRLSELIKISDIEHGYTGAARDSSRFVMDRLVEKAGAAGGIPAGSTGAFSAADLLAYSVSMGQYFYVGYIDLGSLYLGGDSELDLTINVTSDVGIAGRALGVYAVSLEKTPDKMYQYDVSYNPDETHQNVDSIYLFSDPGALAAIIQLSAVGAITSEVAASVQLEDDYGPVLTDLVGQYLATMALSNVEGSFNQTCTVLYRKPDVLPARVYLKINGIAMTAATWRLIVRKVLYDERVLSANTVHQAELLSQRLAILERTQPATAQALRHAGDIVKSTELAYAVAKIA